MRVLITGSSGFCGRHLARLCQQMGAEVTGLARKANPNDAEISWHTIETDLLDRQSLKNWLERLRPARVYHLAGCQKSRNSPDFYTVNVQGTINLLEAISSVGLDSLVLISGSGAVYGRMQSEETAIQEERFFQPLTHYAISKIAQEMVGVRYYLAEHVRVIRTRAFNIVGPNQPDTLVCSSIAKQIAAIELGQQQSEIHVGNLQPQRDFVDVRDAALAYWLVSEKGQSGTVYNVCSGQATTIQHCLELMTSFSRARFQVKADTRNLQWDKIPVQVGDASRLTLATAWKPQVPIEQSLLDLLNYWRERLAKGSQ